MKRIISIVVILLVSYGTQAQTNYPNYSSVTLSLEEVVGTYAGGGSGSISVQNDQLIFTFSSGFSTYNLSGDRLIKDLNWAIPDTYIGSWDQSGLAFWIKNGDLWMIGATDLYHTSLTFNKTVSLIPTNTNEIELNAPLSSDIDVYATKSITLKPGFYTNGYSFKASIADIIYSDYAVVTPDDSYNYVRTVVPQEGYSSSTLESILDGTQTATQEKIMESIAYFDGLGRPSQEMAVRQAPDYSDVVSFHEYDDFGREATKYLRFTTNSQGVYIQSNPIDLQSNYYAHALGLSTEAAQFPFAQTIFDGSPLNRVMKQGAPGEDWQPINSPDRQTDEHVVSYFFNTNLESDRITIFEVPASNVLLKTMDNYSNGALYVTTTTDENGNDSREFKDLQGQVIMKETYDGSQWLKTRYVYDDFGLLRYVIPPEAMRNIGGTDNHPVVHSVATTFVANLCYYYKYDGRKRMIEKKLPGAQPVIMIYDERDRLVLTQDGEQRKLNQYLFTKYDQLNRPAVTGKVTITGTMNDILAFFNDYNKSQVGTYNANGYVSNYNSASGVTFGTQTVLTETYYDDYTFPGAFQFSTYNTLAGVSNENTKVKGQVTGTKARVGDGENWVKETIHYDKKYRVLSIKKTTQFDSFTGEELVGNTYDFVGKLLASKQVQTVNAQTTAVEKVMVYDHVGRLFKIKQNINNAADWETLTTMTYDKLGQLATKTLGNNLQNIDFKYNIRGWLRKMNDADNIGNDLYAQELFYNTNLNGVTLDENKQYNGNISAMHWVSQNNSQTMTGRSYGFSYDGLNRLSSANYFYKNAGIWGSSEEFELTQVAYDLNGNITTLERGRLSSSTPYKNDLLHYTYTGNQLLKVVDDGLLTEGFISSSAAQSLNQQYTYDDNGNLKTDANKAIADIDYNHMNLPTFIIINDGGIASAFPKIYYKYDATGTKYKKTTSDGNGTRYYFSNFEYDKDMNLEYIHTTEGRIRAKSNFAYDYYLKDHLGNTRVVFSDNGSGIPEIQQVSNYYPFGMRFNQENTVNNQTTHYLYNGKELQEDFNLDWYDYGARFYDPALARFHTLDPLAEKFSHQSPYVYADNNPIRFIDFMGMNADEFTFWGNGDLKSYKVTDEPDKVFVMTPDSDWHPNGSIVLRPKEVEMSPEEIEQKMDDNGYKKVIKEETTVKDVLETSFPEGWNKVDNEPSPSNLVVLEVKTQYTQKSNVVIDEKNTVLSSDPISQLGGSQSTLNRVVSTTKYSYGQSKNNQSGSFKMNKNQVSNALGIYSFMVEKVIDGLFK